MNDEQAKQLIESIYKIRTEHTTQVTQEQQWLKDHIESEKLRTIAGSLSVIALHILSALEECDLTGIELAERLHVTRGGVSRAAHKLNEFQLITSVRKADNHKNVYYHLTSEGKEIATVHDHMHKELKKTVSSIY